MADEKYTEEDGMRMEVDEGPPMMDTEIWKRLPDEILPQILTSLPWWSSLRLRGVNRSWHYLLSDPKFLSQCAPLSYDRPPCCILRTSIPFRIGDLHNQKWNIMKEFSETWPGFSISAASSGVFLMRGADVSDNFLVNPLNRTQRRLPPMPKVEDQLVVAGWHYPMPMRVTENPVNVKVVGLQFADGKLTRVFVYDLLRNSWEAVSDNVTSKNFRAVQSALLVGNYVYLLAPSDQLFRVVGFQLVEIPLPGETHEGLVIKHIFQHRGSLMLANGFWGGTEPHPEVDLWRFDHVHESWERVCQMPKRFAVELDRRNDLFKIDAEGDYVGFGCFKSQILILHNIVTSEWWAVPCADYLKCIGCSFLWQPRLDIVL